ncbi:7618_t:CDS:2 [Funneliformis caledonium]|uniref:7618_t:CDS:1 n=1 Tax=Funneliformis caledonium TaxID=1117310 RepID=A0A9N9GI01_9GLOM|nr:7618_t:CDS:2 [Funneliformis caledonium]
MSDNDDDQYQNLTKSIKLQIEIENIRTAAFEVSQLLLDESDNESNMRNKNKAINILLITFSDLYYIFN